MPICTIPDTSEFGVILQVHEADIDQITSGLPVTVTLDTYKGVVLKGSVDKIAAVAIAGGWRDDVKKFAVEVGIVGSSLTLRTGITAKAEIGPIAREIARRAGVSANGATTVLRGLAADGPVWEARLAHAGLFVLDPEHVVTPILRQLTGVVDELLRRIGEHAQGWTLAPAWVGLVDPGGSRDPRTVTLVVLRPGRVDTPDPRWTAQVTELNERVSRWTGSKIVCHEIEEGDIEEGEGHAAGHSA